MEAEYINLTPQNLSDEHLSCIIRSKKAHLGIEAKRQWLSERLAEGHVFRKLNDKAVKDAVFIEYAPLESAWVPIAGDNYYYIYCLWASGAHKSRGCGRELLEYCLNDAKASGRSGVCLLGAKKQKAWLTDQSFARHFGFEVVDTTPSGYELLALSFDGALPHFTSSAKTERIDSLALTVYYDSQCPYVPQSLKRLSSFCDEQNLPLSCIKVDSLQAAKSLPCVFNNWALFYNGTFRTVNLLLDPKSILRILQS